MRRSKKTERAWAAGFFDGEGTTYVNTAQAHNHPGREYRRIRMSVAQAELEPLERFRLAVRVGRIHGPYKNNPKRKEYWVWSVSIWEEVEIVADAIFEFLSGVKRAQFEKARLSVLELRDRPRLKTGPKPKL